MKVAVVYAAKSTEDKHGSIPTQLEDGRRRAARFAAGTGSHLRLCGSPNSAS
jgi:hypothetical protein